MTWEQAKEINAELDRDLVRERDLLAYCERQRARALAILTKGYRRMAHDALNVLLTLTRAAKARIRFIERQQDANLYKAWEQS